MFSNKTLKHKALATSGALLGTERAAALVVLGACLAVLASCGVRVPRDRTLPVGAEVTILPLSLAVQHGATVTKDSRKKLLMGFYSGGKALSPNDSFTIQMFAEPSDPKPLYEFKTTELNRKHLETGCHNSDVHYLENGTSGDMLICDNSIDISRLKYFKLLRPKDTKTATSLIYNFEDENVLAVSVIFF